MSAKRTPPGGAWIGPSEGLSASHFGWQRFTNVEQFLSHFRPWAVVVINDPPGLLRHADFQSVWEHAPFARLIRVVGPYRAGLGRTDPQWPSATLWTSGSERLARVDPASLCDRWVPPTAEYIEIEFPSRTALSLVGTKVALAFSDAELSESWSDWVLALGGTIVAAPHADLQIVDADSQATFFSTRIRASALRSSLTPNPSPGGRGELDRVRTNIVTTPVVQLSAWPWTIDPTTGLVFSKSTPPAEVLEVVARQLMRPARAA